MKHEWTGAISYGKKWWVYANRYYSDGRVVSRKFVGPRAVIRAWRWAMEGER